MIDWEYEWGKRHHKVMLWAARRVPTRLAYWVYIVYGMARIRDDEVVPEVKYTELLGRPPR